MSSVYVLEPPTKGKVLLKTTAGPLDFELWPKEAPKAVRNFVQLCLEGYYDGTIFHRVIKTFMIQGGDRTGSGTGGDTIYGEPFQDEFHSRLRFNHRGVVACANSGSPHTNNSQFFITLDRCDWLDKKNTIFGKVTGDTVYNMLKLGEVETDANDRPLDPPKIISVEVLWNPFDDIFPRSIATQEEKPVEDVVSTKKKKAKKELNLLSFGEEAEEEEQQIVGVQQMKIKSSHDVLNDPRLLKSANDDSQMDATEAKRIKGVQAAVRQALAGSSKLHDTPEKATSRGSSPGSGDEVDFDRKMREQIMERRRIHTGTTKTEKKDRMQDIPRKGELSALTSDKPLPTRDPMRSKIIDDEEDAATKKDKLTIKKKGVGSEARAEIAATADSDIQLLSPLEQQRLRFKQRRRTLHGREENTLGRLKTFASKLSKPNTLTSTSAEATDVRISSADGARTNEKNDSDADWLSHTLKFEVDPTKQGDMSRNDDPDQYAVHDPLLEKGKEKFNKMQARMKRRNRDWAGNSLT